MPIIPPVVALAFVLDGRRVPSYTPVYLADGRVLGPIDPFVTRVAQSMAYRGCFMVLTRDHHRLDIAVSRRELGQLSQTYVALGPVLRALGERVEMDRINRIVRVQSPSAAPVRTPEPFDGRAVPASPNPVFTPEPVSTPRPQWSGSPRPRRTPIPARSWATPPPTSRRPFDGLRG